ncbi:phage terminase small subunit P27 family [Clostridium estertheticum]|uniref:phage terminase small subunit P27 family n=1 Tax=Clostridium estertheticum TaxID=238834 RepID=UPI001C6EC51E|nr:phage terminase small subunit P27 family [Clostridium estertheticum]MBW9170769.1 phage terminase small subunit P27 family [Clostridium estertheticum]WLC74392.1 phage terminase small subunit P27 family [Clostridium estertheticum]
MALASLPVDLQSAHLTKQQITDRKEQEEKLKGNTNLVYKIPRNLSKEEKKVYKFLIAELQPSGILNNLDITILETCSDSIMNMKRCKDNLNEFGLLIPKSETDSTLIRNIASVIYKDYFAIFTKCCMELGMSPSARSKLSVLNLNKKKDEEDPVAKAMRGESNAD